MGFSVGFVIVFEVVFSKLLNFFGFGFYDRLVYS